MEVKDTLVLSIRDVGMNGEGIGESDGFTVFVPYALKGEEIKIAVDKIKGNLAWGHIIKMLKPSPLRETPLCPLFGKCGGCDFQHISLEEERKIKMQNLETVMKKAGINFPISPIVGGNPYYYRNKMALPFGIREGEIVLGFFKEGTHKVIPLTPDKKESCCPLHTNQFNKVIKCVLDYAKENSLSVYNEKSGKGLLRHLVARLVGDSFSIVLVINGNKLPKSEKLLSKLKMEFANFSLAISENTKRNNVIFGDNLTTLYGSEKLEYKTVGIKAEVSPLSFLQVNTPIAEKAYQKILSYVKEDAYVIDAYSGTGVLTVMLAQKAKKVLGIEIIPSAVENANKNAKLNGFEEKITNYCGDTAKILPQIISEYQKDEGDKVVVFDPPRQGVAKEVLESVISAGADSIIYLSCNPATLARDLAILKDDYQICEITPFDFFPRTRHVESVVCLTRSAKAT